jgi:L-threonylcarbamoyladenylate synthase
MAKQQVAKEEGEGNPEGVSLDAFSLAAHLRAGAVGVIATDTLYGIVGSALMPDVVGRIYQVKRRNIKKPLVILISDVEQIRYFGVDVTRDMIRAFRTYWPGKYTLVLPTQEGARFDHLTRGGDTLAFRMPDRADLFELIDLAGPLVAPSANPEGETPAMDLVKAQEYFGRNVDFYADNGKISGHPSTIIRYRDDGEVDVLRDG